MPTVTEIRPMTEPERRSRQRTATLTVQIEHLAQRVAEARAELKRLTDRLKELLSNHPEYNAPNTRQVTLWWGLTAALLGILMMDIVLSWPTSIYYATKFTGLDRQAWIAGVLLPTAVFLFELFVVAGHRVAAAEEAFDGPTSAWIGWTLVGVVVSVTVPLLMFASQLAVAEATFGDDTLPWSHILRIVGVTAIALVLHAAICFSGTAVQDAKGYAVYRVQVARLQGQIDGQGQIVKRSSRRVTALHQAVRLGVPTGMSEPGFTRRAADLINGVESEPSPTPFVSSTDTPPTEASGPGSAGATTAQPDDSGGGPGAAANATPHDTAADLRAREADAEVVL